MSIAKDAGIDLEHESLLGGLLRYRVMMDEPAFFSRRPSRPEANEHSMCGAVIVPVWR